MYLCSPVLPTLKVLHKSSRTENNANFSILSSITFVINENEERIKLYVLIYIFLRCPDVHIPTRLFFFSSSSSVSKSAVKTYTEYFYHPTADNASAANRYFYAFALYMRVHVIESSDSLKNDYKEANTIRIHTNNI